MSGYWSIITPEAGTNWVLNPSAETTGNFAAHNSATVTRDTTYARFGDYSYKIVPGGTNRGVNLTLTALANAIHYVSFYVYGTITGTLQVSLDSGSNYNAATIIGGATGGAVRYGVSVVAAQANGSTALIIRNTVSETFYVDGAQVEANSYGTTYIDGNQGPLYRWSGLRHASTSTRDAQERGGGREQGFDTAFGVQVIPAGTQQIGMPPVVNNYQKLSLQPGAVFSSTKVMPRTVALHFNVPGSTFANLHHVRQQLINLIKPDAARGAQPFILSYSGSGTSSRKVYAAFRYASGLEFGAYKGFLEQPVVMLEAEDPYWYEDSRETTSLTLQTSVASSAYGNRRTNGAWAALGSGFSGPVWAIAVDKQRNRIYFGGDFTTANGVTVNNICYWNGTTFVAMDSGCNSQVNAIAISPNGDVWIGGQLSTVGSALTACKGIAKWSVGGSSWSIISNTSAGFIACYALAVDTNNNLYAGGNWTTYNGVANTLDIFKWDGSSVTALAAGRTVTNALAIGLDGTTLYAGTYGNNGISNWNGSAWTAMSSTDLSPVYAIIVDRAGTIYAGGNFTTAGNYIAAWNGAQWTALGSGPNSAVYAFALADNGLLYVGGNFTTAGGLSLADRLAIWNGYTWAEPDIDLPGSPIVLCVGASPNGDVFIGYITTGTSTASAQTNFTPTSTVSHYPVFTLIGPSTAATTCTLQWIENQSTGQRLYFNLTVNAGETVTIDLTPGRKQVTSDWRGAIAGQPLANSDFANWRLLPTRADGAAANTISAFVTGTQTGVSLLMHTRPTHASADGPA